MSDTCTFAEFLDHCTGRKVMPPRHRRRSGPPALPSRKSRKPFSTGGSERRMPGTSSCITSPTAGAGTREPGPG